MATLIELSIELQQIKVRSVELSEMVAHASEALKQQGTQIMHLTQPSRSGADAARSVTVAGQALAQAAGSMQALERTCNNYLQSIQK